MPRSSRSPQCLLALAACAAVVAAGVTATTAAGPAQAATCNGYVALTFDDGPNAGNTKNLLAALKKAGARATLFNIGQNVQNNQALVKT
ncbi:MAG: peptidoglycan-N-acetylglucosamine deacetylase, partial [Actinomycetota bacterium]|nr:peptidoglycan-N-acetylglucosamine deacetylase [Actinomycetota bacterium]